jgi:ABC-type sugar transport system ATPase subunit
VVEALGSETLVYFKLDHLPQVEQVDIDAGAGAPASTGHLVARVDRRTRVNPGERLRLAFDPSALHYFDRGTHQAV